MRRSVWLLLAVVLAAAAVAVFLLVSPPASPVVTASTKPPKPAESATPVASVQHGSVPPKPAPEPTPNGKDVVMTREIPGEPGGPPLIGGLALQRGELPWEKRMREVLDNKTTSDADKARLLLEMLPTLPVEGRETATEEAVKLVRDRDYRVAETVVVNPATYGPALAILWTDLMERPDAVTLPTLLQVARNPSHPYAPNARENLDLLLGKDYGTDWAAWEAAVRERLSAK